MSADHASFCKTFYDGCELWTSEDGNLLALALAGDDELSRELSRQEVMAFFMERCYCRLADGELPPPYTLRRAYMQRVWKGKEFFDGPGRWQRRGKVWEETQEETPWVVWVLEHDDTEDLENGAA